MSTCNRRSAVAIAVATALLASSATKADDAAPQGETVIVTGSRIARPNLESPVPVTTVSGEEFFETGNTSVGDLLNDLPSIRGTFSQSNSSRFLGTAGLNLLDLRGLGTQRTLVLVNGRRHVGSDILNNAVSPDTNTIPTDLIERVDIVTGGDSAVYGSDAIAGVVNFVMKRNFEGLQVRAQGGQSSQGDAGNYFVSATGGMNFSDNRGNIAASLEYAKQDAFFASERPNLAKNGAFVVVDTDPAGSGSGSDGIPDRQYFPDVRFATIANGGSYLFAPAPNSGLAPCGRDKDGVARSCSLLFSPDGTLAPQTGTRIGLGAGGNFEGGNGTNNRERDALAIFPELERKSINVIGHFTVSDAFDPFIEAKYVQTDSLSFTSPAFFQGTTLGDPRERPRFDNPFLSDAARAVILSTYTSLGYGGVNQPPLPSAATRLSLRRNLLDLGGRQEEATRKTTRIVLGVDGKFADDWSYDVSVNYGQFKEDTQVLGNLNVQRFELAMDSTRDANGNIVCRSKIDPAAALIYPFSNSDEYATSLLAGDVAACVPMNPFGDGSITPAMRNYLLQNTTSVGRIEEFVVSANVTGSSHRWFDLPAGPIGVAFGLEHRTEENFFQSSDLVANGLTFYNALPLFDPPKFKVDEAYAEFRIPILTDKFLARSLTLNAAGRYANYDGNTGGVFANNYGVEWAPIDSLRFRVGKARAIRAPNLSDLYSQQSQNFATVNDPCSFSNIGTGSATRAANCAAAGIPTSYDYRYTESLEILSGGNPDLKEETSDSFTAGLVFQPAFMSGFTLSVDYYDIDIDNVITAPTAQKILNACYDGATLNTQFCDLFQRAGPAGGPVGEIQYRVLEGSLIQTSLNYAKSVSRGIDTEASFATELGSFGQLHSRLVWTHTLQRDDFFDPSAPGHPDQVLEELGDPKDAFNLSLDFKTGPFTIGYQMRYIGTMVLNQAEDTISVGGSPPQNRDYATIRNYPVVIYHDLRAAWDFGNALNVYLNIDNLTDKEPPYGLTGTGGGSAIYDVRGRFFSVGAKYNFGGSGH
jgi:outer membrane receptor protein involved in Fe transport